MADSEVRQKFEAWYLKTPLIDERPKSEIQWESWQAGMREGEIAMKEKAAEACRKRLVGLGPLGEVPYCADLDSAIRALPLSVAEEAKKEKA